MPRKQISIPHPCALDWSELKDSANGKYCNYCSREITDFSAYSQQELLNYLSRHGSAVCGLFSDKQLSPPSKNFWKPLFTAGTKAAVVLFSLLGFQHLNAQSVSSDFQRTDVHFFGTILDSETRVPAAYSTITVMDKDRVVLQMKADNNGWFSGDLGFTGLPNQVLVIIESEDKRTRYEETVISEQLKLYFTRAIPLYHSSTSTATESKTDSVGNSQKSNHRNLRKKRHRGFHPFRRRPRYKVLGMTAF